MEHLKLENQLCFPFYTVSRLIIRKYKPLLDKLGITYPQYLVLLTLWEEDHQPVNDIAKRLYLQTNTVTPLIQRLEALQIVERVKSEEDERKVIVSLTQKGRDLQMLASDIPYQLGEGIQVTMSIEELQKLKKQLDDMIQVLA